MLNILLKFSLSPVYVFYICPCPSIDVGPPRGVSESHNDGSKIIASIPED